MTTRLPDPAPAESSILDLPKKDLNPDVWDRADSGAPRLNKELRKIIEDQATKFDKEMDLGQILSMHFYGGNASRQWRKGGDIDTSFGCVNYDPLKAKKIHELEIPWKGYTITFFLKPDASTEVAEAVYDVMNDTWILTPVVLPEGFNVETWYAKDMENAEKICEQLDIKLGKLHRLKVDLEKYTAEPVDQLVNPEDRSEAIDKTKTDMKAIMYELASTFIQYHTARNVAHEKLMADPDRKPMDRFTPAEIVWKYLERMGYLDTLHQLAQAHDAGDIERL